MKAFFDAVRPMFGGQLTAKQVAGLETLMAATEGLPISHRAYLLATTFHETGQTMQPIAEYGGRKYFNKYDTGKLAKALGNTPDDDGDGFKYRGRGYVQLTGRANYAKAAKATGADLVNNPNGALNPDLAAMILVRGCSKGWFTGKTLSDYLPGDYIGARRVVNGTDKAANIAKCAETFEAAFAAIDKPTGLIPPKLSLETCTIGRPSLTPVPPKSNAPAIVAALAALVAVIWAWLTKG